MEIVTTEPLKGKMVKMLKNVTCMPANLDLSFMEMISEACSWEDGDCDQKVIEKVLMKLWGLCCHSSATNKDKTY